MALEGEKKDKGIGPYLFDVCVLFAFSTASKAPPTEPKASKYEQTFPASIACRSSASAPPAPTGGQKRSEPVLLFKRPGKSRSYPLP